MTFKEKLNKITFVIPIFNLKDERLENFKFILSKICKITDHILVVEQVSDKRKTSDAKRYTKELGIDHLAIQVSNDDRIHKSKLINAGTREIDTEFVWVNDADCYLKFKDIIENNDFNHNFIQPYTISKNLLEDDSSALRSGKSVDINFDVKTDTLISLYGALSFIFRKKAFIDIGGMDENFVGFGFEDNDLCYRVFRKSFDQFAIFKNYGIHLWHEINHVNKPANGVLINKKHSESLSKQEIFLGRCYRLKTYENIEIVTLFRGNKNFLSNITNFLESERAFINRYKPKITWVVNSNNQDFIDYTIAMSKAFDNINIAINDDIGGHNVDNYFDANIHAPISDIYNDVFLNTRSDALITLEDDVIPCSNGLEMLYSQFCSPSDKRIGAIGGIYIDRGYKEIHGKSNIVCGIDADGARRLFNETVNSGRIPYNCIPGGFTIYDSALVKQCLPINRFREEYTGWDWKVSQTLINSNIELYIDTDIVCNHLI
jgi:hypothetical protein